MGQQQLLLLVLGMVIVGIAVVAGIQAFSEGKEKAARDAAVSDAMRIISDIQAWKMKPTAFGGGASSSGVPDFYQLGYPEDGINESDSKTYQTVNGCYTIKDYSSSGFSDAPGTGIANLEIKLFDNGACASLPVAEVAIATTAVNGIYWKWNQGGT